MDCQKPRAEAALLRRTESYEQLDFEIVPTDKLLVISRLPPIPRQGIVVEADDRHGNLLTVRQTVDVKITLCSEKPAAWVLVGKYRHFDFLKLASIVTTRRPSPVDPLLQEYPASTLLPQPLPTVSVSYRGCLDRRKSLP